MAKKKGADVSILAVIQKMVEAGEPREKIVATLHDLGVTKQQAERLLLIGEARTFQTLEGEIARIARNQVDEEKPKLHGYVKEATEREEKVLKKELHGALRVETEALRSQMEENLRAVNDFTASMEARIEKNEERLARQEGDLRKLEVRGLGPQNEWVRLILILGGIAFIASSAYLFFVESPSPTLDSLIRTIVIALTGITMIFGSTLV